MLQCKKQEQRVKEISFSTGEQYFEHTANSVDIIYNKTKVVSAICATLTQK